MSVGTSPVDSLAVAPPPPIAGAGPAATSAAPPPPLDGASASGADAGPSKPTTASVLSTYGAMVPDQAAAAWQQDRGWLGAQGVDTGRVDRHFAAAASLRQQQDPMAALAQNRNWLAQNGYDVDFLRQQAGPRIAAVAAKPWYERAWDVVQAPFEQAQQTMDARAEQNLPPGQPVGLGRELVMSAANPVSAAAALIGGEVPEAIEAERTAAAAGEVESGLRAQAMVNRAAAAHRAAETARVAATSGVPEDIEAAEQAAETARSAMSDAQDAVGDYQAAQQAATQQQRAGTVAHTLRRARRGLGAAFAGQQAVGAGEQAAGAYQAARQGEWGAAGSEAGAAALNAALAGLGGWGAYRDAVTPREAMPRTPITAPEFGEVGAVPRGALPPVPPEQALLGEGEAPPLRQGATVRQEPWQQRRGGAVPQGASSEPIPPPPLMLPRGIATGEGQPLPSATPGDNELQRIHRMPAVPPKLLGAAPPEAQGTLARAARPVAPPRFVAMPAEGGLVRAAEGGTFVSVPPGGGLLDLAPEPAAPRGPVRGLLPAAPEGIASTWRTAPQTAMPQGEPLAGAAGTAATLKTTEGDYPVRYRAVEASDLVPSHEAGTFAPNPRYPEGVQERTYDLSPAAQARVEQQVQQFDPGYLLNSNPDAVNGPPVVTPSGLVLGGNSRTMTVQRVYGADRGGAYREALLQQAPQFGLDRRQVAAMRQPVLVRELRTSPATVGEAANLATNLNRSMTGALGDAELAVGRGRAVSPETLAQVARLVDADGGDVTLAQLAERHPRELVDALVRDGAISQQERPAIQDARTGALTTRGKDFVQKALVGSVLPDASLLEAAPASVLQKVTRALPALAELGSTGGGWDMTGPLMDAVQAHTVAHAGGMSADDYLRQQHLFGGELAGEAALMAEALDGTPRQFSRAMERLASAARANRPGQGLLAGIEPETAVEALARVVAGAGEAQPVAASRASKAGDTARSLRHPLGIEGPRGQVALFYGGNHATALSQALGLPGVVGGMASPDAEAKSIAQGLGAAGEMELAQALHQALVRPHHLAGVVMVMAGDREDTWKRLIEEHAHLLQASLGPLPGAAAAQWTARGIPQMALGGIAARYSAVNGYDRSAVLDELGAHALAGDWQGLALTPAQGEKLRQSYVALLDDTFGKGRVDAELTRIYGTVGEIVEAARAGRPYGVGGFDLGAFSAAQGAPGAVGAAGQRTGGGAPAWRAYNVSPATRLGTRFYHSRHPDQLALGWEPAAEDPRLAEIWRAVAAVRAEHGDLQGAQQALEELPSPAAAVSRRVTVAGEVRPKGAAEPIEPEMVREWLTLRQSDGEPAIVLRGGTGLSPTHTVRFTVGADGASRIGTVARGEASRAGWERAQDQMAAQSGNGGAAVAAWNRRAEGTAAVPLPLVRGDAGAGPEPNEIERRAHLGQSALWHATGARDGTLYLDGAGWTMLRNIWQQAFGLRPGADLAGLAVKPQDFPPLLAALRRHPGDAWSREVMSAIAGSPDGLAIVRHGSGQAALARWEEGEDGHRWQGRADRGDPADAIGAADAVALVTGVSPSAGELLRRYDPSLAELVGAGHADRVAPFLAAEIGVRLLQRRFGELGLDEAQGERWRAYYLESVERRWGRAGIERANVRNAAGVKLDALADSHQGPGPALPTGGYPGAAFPLAQAGTDEPRRERRVTQLTEPERGPIARAFQAWDRATEPLARAGRKVEGLVATHRGVSAQAQQALRSYRGRREFEALQSMRIAEGLYRDERELFGRALTAEEGLQIQRAIEKPDKVTLAPTEQAMRERLVAVRDDRGTVYLPVVRALRRKGAPLGSERQVALRP